jgi:hypothetical protein
MNAVLFDFSGTLFRIESTESWLRAVLRETGIALPEPELVEAARALESAGAMPGGAQPEQLPEEFAEMWARSRNRQLQTGGRTAGRRLDDDGAAGRSARIVNLNYRLTHEHEPLDISLADLIARLDEELPGANELARISEARLRAQTLSDLGDQLIDHYVSKAKQDRRVVDRDRRRHRGVQAGRPATPRTRPVRAVHQPEPAQHRAGAGGRPHAQARLHRHRTPPARPARRTAGPGVRGAGREDRVGAARPRRDRGSAAAGREKALRGHIAFRPESKEAIDQARRAAADLGHDWVGTEHTLLGLIRVEESPAAQILRNLGFTPDELHETVEAEIANRLAGRGK